MSDEHKRMVAVLLERADDPNTHGTMIEPLLLEALVHAVLHLAEVIEVRETIGSGR